MELQYIWLIKYYISDWWLLFCQENKSMQNIMPYGEVNFKIIETDTLWFAALRAWLPWLFDSKLSSYIN